MKYTKSKIIRVTLAAVLMWAMFVISLPTGALGASPGALDPTFGTGGKFSRDIFGNDDVWGVTVQPDGKIIVVGGVGNAGTPTDDFGIVRFNSNGSLDTTFDGDGIVLTDFSSQRDEAFAVAIQPDGKIVVVGSTQPVGGTANTAVARYLPNGALDTTFDTDGKAVVDVAVGGIDYAQAVAIEDDGKIITAGLAGNDFAVLRFNIGGTLNTAFDGDGIVTTDFTGGADLAFAIVVQTDGKIVAAGDTNGNFAMARYNVNGSLDTTFDTDGLVTTSFGGSAQILGLAIQTDNKLVAAGWAGSAGEDFALARYNPNGSLDTTFDGDGKVTTNVSPPSGSDLAFDLAIQSDGKIVAAGESNLSFAVTRYNANGSLDTSFGNGGSVITDIDVSSDGGRSCVLYGDKLVVVGESNNVADWGVARYNLLSTPTENSDFDGDGFSDYAIFRPSTVTWYILKSGTGTTQIFSFGLNGDVPLDGDFDGDGKSDIAIFRPSNGQWWIQRSSTGLTFAVTFGQNGDKPVPGDVDKDGKTDLVIWRPSNGNWYVLRSSNGFSSYFSFPFGTNGDIPVGTAIFP